MSPAGAPPVWRCGRHLLSLERVLVMGVLNVTPDSFSDGGRHDTLAAAIAHAHALVAEGADIIDIGGESTRPGAAAVPDAVERARVLPVLQALRDLPVPLSVDTSQPALMHAALDLGVSILNDVRALRREGALAVARASTDCGIVLMHMIGEPAGMQAHAHYADVVEEVRSWLGRRRDEVVAAGIDPARIALDPGFGFSKTRGHNRALLSGLRGLAAIDQPLLVGLSRKSTLGELTGRPVTERLAASLAAALLAVHNGARVVRVHDVGATRDALAVWQACAAPQPQEE